MSDKKNSEPQFISAKDSDEWSQVLHGEIPPDAENEAHKEAELVRKYLLVRDEAKAIEKLPEVDVLTTMSPDEARVIYQKTSKEIHRRGSSWWTRLKTWFVPVALGGLSAAVVFLYLDKSTPPDQNLIAQIGETSSAPAMEVDYLKNAGYKPIVSGGLPGKYPNMLLMLGGKMKMGCTIGWDDVVGGCRGSEFPPHYVDIKPFEIAQHEVTVGQFKRFIDATNYQTEAEIDSRGCVHQDLNKSGQPFLMNPEYTWRNPGFEQDESHPVTCVSWSDAQAYLQWLNKETKRQFRLPSESEWEFAARGGKSTAYFWGAANDSIYLWANHNNEKDGWPNTAPVGSFPANKYLVQDTSGNVWEMVQDCWHETYDGAPVDNSVWETGCNAPSVKTRRGGAWDGGSPGVRSAIRSPLPETDRSNLYGFRIAHSYKTK